MIRQNNNQKPVGENEVEELSEEALSEVTGGYDVKFMPSHPSHSILNNPQALQRVLQPQPQSQLIATHGDVTAHRVGDQVALTRPGGGTNNLHVDLYNHMVNTGNIHLMFPR